MPLIMAEGVLRCLTAGTVLTVLRWKSATLSRAGWRMPTGPRANSSSSVPVTLRVNCAVASPSRRSHRSTIEHPQRSVPALKTPDPDRVV